MAQNGTLFRGTALAAALVTSGLAGCSTGENVVRDRFLSLLRSEVFAGERPDIGRTTEPTREQLNRIPQATIGFSYGELRPVYMIPLANNGGYLTYQDKGQRGVVMFGGAVAGTLGLGADLQSVRHAQDDPIARRTPLAEWPDTLVRAYEYRVRDLDDYVVTVACELEPQERVVYEIVEVRYTVTRVRERCGNAVREFENTYWVDDSGFIWASEQWLGPDLATGTIEIVRPYGG